MSEAIPQLPVQPLASPRPAAKRGLSLGGVLLLIVITTMGLIFALTLAKRNQGQPTEGLAPTFSFTTFDGQSYDLADFRGKVVVLNFWAGWCVECSVEAPELQDAWEHYEPTGEVVFLGIAYADNGPSSLAYLKKYGITYLNAPDLGTRISEAYRITGVPETFIIDQEGNVARFIIGGVNQARLRTIIDPLLEG
jgi:cytochrome c biogenesis protein CcmG/thiol:disulfide interchange protein DsbE